MINADIFESVRAELRAVEAKLRETPSGQHEEHSFRGLAVRQVFED